MSRRSFFGLLSCVIIAAACTQEPVTVPVRSLEQSGHVAWLCLASPDSLSAALPLENCSAATTDYSDEYYVDENGETGLPHLYALVTQTTRGEVAVIDLTAESDPVLDQDPGTPGANFLPIAAQPIDIVATPGSTAAFVSVAEVGRQGIFAIPSEQVRRCDGCAPAEMSSWPACSLPAAPGNMVVAFDPLVDGEERSTCDGEYGDSSTDTYAHGNLSSEGYGRQKLVVMMPDLGGMIVVDAQTLLDRDAGSFDECPVDRWVPFEVSVAVDSEEEDDSSSLACVNPKKSTTTVSAVADSRPAGLALSDDRLYVSDLSAPVVHELQMVTPCDPIELDPLRPSSMEDPSRVVTTSRVAVTTEVGADMQKYLYAVDANEGSVMVFNISADAEDRSKPIQRTHPEWNPFQPPDRIKFSSPVQDILVLERDVPLTVPATGTAMTGERCDPDPDLTECSSSVTDCDPGTLYRTSSEYDSGAGPYNLRGTFAFLLLSSGQIVTVDIDDYDAWCRAPTSFTSDAACPPAGYEADVDDGTEWSTSGEASCNVSMGHTVRSAAFVTSNDTVGNHAPGMQIYPLLYDKTGALIALDDAESPMMRAPMNDTQDEVLVGAVSEEIDSSTGQVVKEDGPRHTLLMNLEDPHAHYSDQGWNVTFEGALPGTSGKFGDLRLSSSEVERGIYDGNTRFCDLGVQSQAMVEEILLSQGMAENEAEELASELADSIQITSELISQEDVYWDSATCTYQTCASTFGTPETARIERDVRINEAYQDHVELGQGVVDDSLIKCCFPSLVTFNVRPRNQWTVLGESVGFLHHVIEDPSSGVCRNSCDSTVERKNGRVRMSSMDTSGLWPAKNDVLSFLNPMFRFAITNATIACESSDDCGGNECSNGLCEIVPERDMQYRFTTVGSFIPLYVNLAALTSDIQPQYMMYSTVTREIAITDGSLEGLILMSTDSVSISRQFF